MRRHVSFQAAGLIVLLAAQQAYADSISCSFTTEHSVIGTNVGPNGGSSVFEIEDFSFDIEQTLNIGSQSSGAGAGKVTFNPFQITRKVDSASPQFFQMAVRGTLFRAVSCSFYGMATTDGVAPNPYLTAVLTNARIGKFKIEGMADGTQRAKFWFDYQRIEWK
jgi:type VI secretion system Hcp family effector